MAQPKTYYRRHLPHYQPPDAIYHVVFRLAGSMPAEVVEQLRQERLTHEKLTSELSDANWRNTVRTNRRHFERFEQLLDGCTTGPWWLQEQEVATIIAEAIRYRDNRDCDMMIYCIMPNHVDAVFAV